MARAILASVPRGTLQLRLGFAFAIAVSIGNIIGSGIMRTPGLVADQVPVAATLVLLWALGGLHALLSSNVASELATSIPQAGGTYVPVRRAFGESAGLLCGWTDWLSNVAGIAALSTACANFAAMILPALAPHTAAVAATFAIAIIALNWRGVREGQVAQTVGSAIKVALILGVIATAFLAAPISEGRIAPAAAATAAAPVIGFAALIAAYQMIYGAYTGWHAPIYFVEEDANARSNIPRAMALSILAVTAIYVALNLSLLHALDLAALRRSDLPVATVIEHAFGRTGGIMVALLAIVIVVVAINAIVMASARVLFGLARDGLFLPSGARVNAGGTPDVALGITAVLALLLISSGGFAFLFKLTAALAIFGFFLYEASLFALRWKEPDLARPFRARLYPWLPALVCLLDLGLLIAFLLADPTSGLWMAGLIAICLPVGMILRHRQRTPATGTSAPPIDRPIPLRAGGIVP